MAQFHKLFISVVVLGLLIVSLLSFVILTQEDNNIDNKFIDNSLINNTYATLKSDLTSFRDDSQAQKTLFESENPTIGFGTILLFSIVSAGKVFNGMMVGTFNTLIKLPVVVLGFDPVVLSVLSTLLIIAILLGLWAIYKLGG